HAGQQVIGKNSFRPLPVPVHVKRDALGHKRQINGALAARDFLRRKVQERFQYFGIVRSYQAVLSEHLVIGVVEDVVLQERIAERAGSGYSHYFLNPDAASVATSSLTTLKWVRLAIPNEVVIATSEASRPTAINTRPMRGWLCRASTVHQRLA